MTIFIVIAIMLTFGIVFTVGRVMPRQRMSISSEITISRPKEEILNYVKLLRHQEKYNTWMIQDPKIKMTYTGTDGTEGFIAAWESSTRIGNGEQQIMKVHEGEGYESELRFRNNENVTHSSIMTQALGQNETKVTYTMSATPSFPMDLMIPRMKKVLKKEMDESLANLKKILEA